MARINVNTDETFINVQISGELQAGDADDVTETLFEHVAEPGAKVLLDLQHLESIDSSGLNAMIQVVTRARLGHGRVILVNPQPLVAGVFDVTRLNTWFEICHTLAEARARLAQD